MQEAQDMQDFRAKLEKQYIYTRSKLCKRCKICRWSETRRTSNAQYRRYKTNKRCRVCRIIIYRRCKAGRRCKICRILELNWTSNIFTRGASFARGARQGQAMYRRCKTSRRCRVCRIRERKCSKFPADYDGGLIPLNNEQ